MDPVDQSRALLVKLVVRSFMPGEEWWKQLLHNRMSLCAPEVGQPWKGEVRWIFNNELKIKTSRKGEDGFIAGI